jgi:hypothetical protein
MDTEDNFTLLAEKICSRYYGGSLPDDAQKIASEFLTSTLPNVPDSLNADEGIARLAFERISDSLVIALQAHHATHKAAWEN